MRFLTAAALVAALAAGALPGCIVEPTCPEPRLPEVLTPWVEGPFLRTDPSQPWDTVLFVDEGQAVGEVSLNATLSPVSWSLERQPLGPGGEGGFSLLRVTPGSGAAQLSVGYGALTQREGQCTSGERGLLTWDLAKPKEGDMARPGQGVHVLTAGFWENGTLFYTNIEALDQDGAWPKADWYAWEGGDPLPVYVYDEDRSEQPAAWHGTTAGTPLGPPTQNLTLWDYYTTIRGFNEALKGLSTNTARVVRLAPEDAYTRPGNEQHPLYGDALVFYIKVLDVVDVPCPEAAEPRLCALPGLVTMR